jgi:cobalt-zinc-cadmium resistance protein CzcA
LETRDIAPMFESVGQALLIVLNIPFALVGGIAALWVRGMNLNLSASIGFIALFGVAMLNGVVLVSSVNEVRKAGGSLRDSVMRGARRRLRPVLMTASGCGQSVRRVRFWKQRSNRQVDYDWLD